MPNSENPENSKSSTDKTVRFRIQDESSDSDNEKGSFNNPNTNSNSTQAPKLAEIKGPEEQTSTAYEAAIAEGDKNFAEKKYSGALEHYETAITLSRNNNSECANAWYKRAEALYELCLIHGEGNRYYKESFLSSLEKCLRLDESYLLSEAIRNKRNELMQSDSNNTNNNNNVNINKAVAVLTGHNYSVVYQDIVRICKSFNEKAKRLNVEQLNIDSLGLLVEMFLSYEQIRPKFPNAIIQNIIHEFYQNTCQIIIDKISGWLQYHLRSANTLQEKIDRYKEVFGLYMQFLAVITDAACASLIQQAISRSYQEALAKFSSRSEVGSSAKEEFITLYNNECEAKVKKRINEIAEPLAQGQNDNTEKLIGCDNIQYIPGNAIQRKTPIFSGNKAMFFSGVWKQENAERSVIIQSYAKLYSQKNSGWNFESLVEQNIFNAEVKLLHQLPSSQYVCQFYGYDISPDYNHIVMEDAPGGMLATLLRNPDIELSWSARLSIATDIAKGLKFLHKQLEGIYHLNATSETILLDKNMRPKITSFFTATLVRLSDKDNSQFNPHNMGTIGWMAPELLNEEEIKFNKDTKRRAEVYTFGVLLYEIAARKPPYEGKNREEAEELNKKNDREGEVIPATTPPKFAKLIQHCWTTKPSERPRLSQVMKKLEEIQNDLPKLKK